MTGVSIVIPAYNEQDSIVKTIQEVKEILSKSKNKYEIIIVNDGSKDNTSDILRSIKNIIVINHPYNKGYGASIKTGIKNSKYDWILITDSDGTYPGDAIPSLLKYLPEYDMVVGARTGNEVNIPLFRKPAKFIIGKVAN